MSTGRVASERPTTAARAPATQPEAPLPGQEREHRQAVGVGLHRLEHLLHAIGRGQLEGLGQPRVEAPAIRQGAAQKEAAAVDAVAPEAVRDRDPVGGKADPHGAGGPDHERRPLGRRAAGADVGARAVAQRRQPRDARQGGPARGELGPEPPEGPGPGPRWDRGVRHRARGPRGCPGPSAAAHWSKRPVPDAIETLVRSSPKRPEPQVLPERHPPAHPAKRGRVALAEPPEPRREIGRVQPAPGPRVVRLLVDPRSERLHAHRRSACPPRSRRASPDDRPARDRAACARRCSWRPPPPRRHAGRGSP